ncbi:DKNYY domain-containing protein [Fusobacterium canifelinum]|uniref:DKNYY domain-containing protein n=1 Tax=Fusobacterium canifelinum TaxID=285729 RepID=A0A7T4FQY0_9FUSO|nr:DKNYY domain-containing protein [Fusobacterium canifelinum]QQB74991.1 DKNYY domain-containing protein [Fusobacterium canifelinum]
MKINDFDEDFNFEKKRTSNTLFILKIVGIIIVMFVFFNIFFISKMQSSDSYEIGEKGERYENSEFIKYQGEIYVLIPSGGMYVLENVDIDTFKPLNPKDYYSKIVGLDKNNVYFGNIAIPDLNPATFYSIGNGYYSDGTNTYFCSLTSERNKNLSTPMEILQSLMYSFSKTKKPQTYIYPYKKLETNNKLIAVKDLYYFATDGEKVYYKGEILENADIDTLKNVNNEYFVDKENVYYKSKILPIKNSGKLVVVSNEQGDEFLYDEANGYVFIGDYSFDKEKAPYKVVGNNGNHLYNLIFIAKDGVYYYNNQKKKQERVGDNIFIGEIKELSPNTFSDDENIYYFHAYKIWHKLKGGGRILSSINTEIYCLDRKNGWEKVTDIEGGIVGSIWKKGENYYYFDNEGIFQSINDTIYKISDKNILEYLMNVDNADSDKIRKLIENEKLIKIAGEKKIEIVVKYESAEILMIKYSKIFLVLFVIGAIILKVVKKLKK